MIERACVNCGGAVYFESFKAEGRRFVEATCINCARQWTPRTISQWLATLREAGKESAAKLVEAEFEKVSKQGHGRIVID
jgi:hypothetical protein